MSNRFLGGKEGVLLVLAVSAAARVVVSFAQYLWGIHPLPDLLAPTMWADFYRLYVPQVGSLASGALPYTGFGYSFTPLFIYSMLPFYEIGGAFLSGSPIVFFDAMTAPFVYLIVRGHADNRVALGAGIAYALMPLALVNEAYLWMGNQPALFFMILTLFLFDEGHFTMAMTSLGVAAMFRQEAIVLAVPLVLWESRQQWRVVVKGAGALGAVALAVSAPFLVESPSAYLSAISYGLLNIGQRAATNASIGNVTSLAPSSLPLCTQAVSPSLLAGSSCELFAYFGGLSFNLIALTNAFAGFVSPILFAVTLVGTYAVRRHPSAIALASSQALVGLLVLFSLTVHSVLGYYFLPVYGILLAGVSSRSTLLSVFAGAAISFFMPEGAIQLLVALMTILALITLSDKESHNSPQRIDVAGLGTGNQGSARYQANLTGHVIGGRGPPSSNPALRAFTIPGRQ